MKLLRLFLISAFEDRRGGATLEACLILPVIISALLFGLSTVQTVTAVNCIDRALYKTSRLLSDYGILYHEYGIAELENAALSKLGSLITEKTGDGTGNSILTGFFGLRECAESFDDLMYTQMSEVIFNRYLKEDPLVKNGYVRLEKISLSGSSFFNGSDDIELYASARIFGFVKIGSSIKTRAWIRGNNPLLSLNESGITVWDMTNFARGKVLRTIFGSNLPYDYPVVAIFDEKTGAATMIKSLDFTAPSYRTGTGIEKEIREMIKKFGAFNTTDGYQLRDGYPEIKPGSIKTKKLLLILPMNEMSEVQSAALSKIITYAVSERIQVELIGYQKSSKYFTSE